MNHPTTESLQAALVEAIHQKMARLKAFERSFQGVLMQEVVKVLAECVYEPIRVEFMFRDQDLEPRPVFSCSFDQDTPVAGRAPTSFDPATVEKSWLVSDRAIFTRAFGFGEAASRRSRLFHKTLELLVRYADFTTLVIPAAGAALDERVAAKASVSEPVPTV